MHTTIQQPTRHTGRKWALTVLAVVVLLMVPSTLIVIGGIRDAMRGTHPVTTAPSQQETGLFSYRAHAGSDRSPPIAVSVGQQQRYLVAWTSDCPVGTSLTSASDLSVARLLVPDASRIDRAGNAYGGYLPADLPPGSYYVLTSSACSFDLYAWQMTDR